jgi:hypothetical protein
VEELSKVGGISKILVAENEAYGSFLAGIYAISDKRPLLEMSIPIFINHFSSYPFVEVMAPVIFASQQQFGFSHIAAGSTAFGKVVIDNYNLLFTMHSLLT